MTTQISMKIQYKVSIKSPDVNLFRYFLRFVSQCKKNYLTKEIRMFVLMNFYRFVEKQSWINKDILIIMKLYSSKIILQYCYHSNSTSKEVKNVLKNMFSLVKAIQKSFQHCIKDC